ncbi:MAG: Na+/H+ antiporter NhaD and related arsenite permeases [uncultured Rubrobacteraceae bacterium]|uniref:Na+/H+ antiporter NhaD and related arsenite permeases n=1 Tax=uncultured Rubrobacteraceae bacterium TaxID=349277 RepID=A0A6J4PN04_9ACTN|nr:MAG: Na+/H+ antiporter NhaD and related arsenite permeases [uncultured Rubrobacteraceae bacterium]
MMFFALAVFAVVLFVFAMDLVHRTPAALAGGVLLVIVGAIGQEEAIEAVHWETLGLLVGMMILVGILKDSGVFGYLAIKSAQWAGGRPGLVLIYLAGITALLSAFLDNVTTVLLMFPVTLVIAQILEEDPIPFLIVEVLASNIGGTATLVGDPPNIIIGTVVEELTFMDFIVNLAPPIVVILLVTLGLVWLVHGRKLHTSEEDRKGIMALQAAEEIEDRKLLVRAGAVCGATVIGFFLQQVTGLNPAIVALAGAAVAMLVCGPEVEKVLHEVEWPTILFFVGLFVMVGALEATGFIDAVAHSLASASDSLAGTAMIVMWGSGFASGVVDNIPFTATMIPVIEGLAESRGYDAATTEPLWWSLSLGACLGGNFTLIGASANLVVAGLVAREGMTTFTFLRFLLWGFPLTLVALAISSAYILLFQLG